MRGKEFSDCFKGVHVNTEVHADKILIGIQKTSIIIIFTINDAYENPSFLIHI